MALIELTADDLCALLSSPFPCEEGTIIDPVAAAHALGFVETSSAVLEDDAASSDAGGAATAPARERTRAADTRLVMVSLACSMEASQAVDRARAAGTDRAGLRQSLNAFTAGVTASPLALTTVLPPAGTVVVVGTTVLTVPSPPPVPPRWDEGERLSRTDLLALAGRFQAASKMPGVGDVAQDLAAAAERLIDAAMTR